MRFADLDAVTVDGMGTLIEVEDPVPRLRAALEAHGVERSPAEVAAAFVDEVAHYRPRSHTAGRAAELAELRLRCVGVFLGSLGATIAPERFVDEFLGALVFRPASGAVAALERARSEGLAVAVVSNWDCSLPDALEAAGVRELADVVVASADVGTPKPDPRPFLRALELLGVEPARALHVGDEHDDEAGAAAAGMHFAPAPLDHAIAELA